MFPALSGTIGEGLDHADVHCHVELDRSGNPQRQGFAQALQAAREAAKKLGVDIKQVFLTTGEFDLLAVMDAANGDNVAKLIMTLGAQGNLRSRTVRAWPEADYVKLISELP